MKYFKKTLIKLSLLLFLLFAPFNITQANDVNVYFFHGDGCPHCAAEKDYLEKLKNQTDLKFNLREYEIWYDQENTALLSELAENQNWNITGVPFTIIGNETFTGYLDDASTGESIKNAITNCNTNICQDPVAEFIGQRSLSLKDSNSKNNALSSNIKNTKKADPNNTNKGIPDTISLPLFGELNTKNLSLPLITIIIAAIDGFNPCAMWVLIFLISMLLGIQNKRRRWILGGTFIIASGAVYFMFLAAWLNIILFIGFVAWVRIAIGVVAIGTAAYSIRDYFTNPHAVCKVTDNEKRKNTFEKLKQFVHEKNLFLALGGIIILAAAVNLVELICSAGLPAIFTQILVLSNLPTWEYYSLMLLYILIFMLDDMIIFGLAMKTLEIKSISSKFTRYSSLIGGIIMLILGILLLFKPELLMFG